MTVHIQVAQVHDAPYPPAGMELWRVNHDKLPLTRPNLPEVHQLAPAHYSRFGREWQLLERRLNAHLTDTKWRAGHTWKRAMNNGMHGYGGPGEPLADFVNGQNMASKPIRQEALLMGGAIVAGHAEGDDLVVDTLDASGAVPRLEDLQPWQWFTAVNIDEGDGGKTGIVRRFLNGEEFRYLVLADRARYPKVTLALSKVVRLDVTEPLPSPYEYP